MTPTVWSVAILVAAAAGLLALRTLSRRIRLAFDVVCLVALSVVLHQRGATPILASSAAAPDAATLWLRVLVVVASGVLELTRATGTTTTSLTLGRIGAGEYIGEIGLLTGSPHSATARARTHCVVYQLRREASAGLLETNAEVAAALEKSVRRGLELMSRKVAAAATGAVGVHGQLLQRIRRFFRSDAA